MPVIVNLSSLHALYPPTKSVDAFSDICNRYSKGSFSSCSSFFQSWSNYAWVMYQYKLHERSLIQPYRLGAISTDQFLARLLDVFSFLKDAEPESGEMARLHAKNLYSKTFPLMLLEDAWNATVAWDESKAERFTALVRESEPVDLVAEVAAHKPGSTQADPIYIVSNTNHLHVLQILHFLRKENPQINFYTDVDVSIKDDKKPIEIAPDVFLCISYRCGIFKTQEENRQVNPNSTMSLLNYLVTDHLSTVRKSDIRVISQHKADLAEAARIGVDETNIFSADEFFTAHTSSMKKTN